MKAREFDQVAREQGDDFLSWYLDARADGRKPAEAFFAAWSLQLPSERQIRTMKELADLLGYNSDNILYKWKRREWYLTLVETTRRNRVLRRLRPKADSRVDNLLESPDERIALGAARLVYEEARYVEAQTGQAGEVEQDWWEAA